MALSQSTLQAKLLNWLNNKADYTTLAKSADEFAKAYDEFAQSATANGQPIILGTNDPNLISTPIKAIPSFDPGGTLWATAVGQAIQTYWNAISFNPIPGPIIVSIPPNGAFITSQLLAVMFSTYILPTATDLTVATSMASIFYNAMLTAQATVTPPLPASHYNVPII